MTLPEETEGPLVTAWRVPSLVSFRGTDPAMWFPIYSFGIIRISNDDDENVKVQSYILCSEKTT